MGLVFFPENLPASPFIPLPSPPFTEEPILPLGFVKSEVRHDGIWENRGPKPIQQFGFLGQRSEVTGKLFQQQGNQYIVRRLLKQV